MVAQTAVCGPRRSAAVSAKQVGNRDLLKRTILFPCAVEREMAREVTRDDHALHFRCESRAESVQGILEDDHFRGVHSELACRVQKQSGIRLGFPHILE